MPEAPSKTELLERRAERAMVREGKSVLEDRRDLLAHLLIDQIKVTEQLAADAERVFAIARRLLRRAVMRHGPGGLARQAAAAGEPSLASPRWAVENRLGASWLSGPAAAETPVHEGEPTGDGDDSVELDGTRRAYRDLLAVLLSLAAAENNLLRLIEVFRRTQRRVNALEHIVLPDLNHAIKEMEDRMDEMERDDLVRSLLIKRRGLR